MKTNISYFYLAAILTLLGGMAGVQAQTPFSIPLHPFTFINGNGFLQTDYSIDVGVNGGAPRPYLFDTGSSVFEAVIGDSAYSLTNPVTGVTPLATNFTYTYQTGDGFAGTLVETSVSFYANLDPASFIATISTAAGGSTNGLIVNAISDHLIGGTNDTNYWQSVATNGAPIYGNLVGTFGAGTFLSTTTNGIINSFTNSITYGGVLGQATTNGYIVSLNSASNPTVTLGLNDALKNQFSTLTNANLATVTNGNVVTNMVFPGSGTPSFQEREVNLMETITGTNTTNHSYASNTYSVSALLDTGTGNLNTKNDSIQIFTDSEGNIYSGNNFSVSLENNSLLSITTDEATNNLIDSVGAGEYTLGIGMFLSNSVMYDLQNGQLGFSPSVVNVATVPEPPAFMLAVLGFLALITVSRRARLL